MHALQVSQNIGCEVKIPIFSSVRKPSDIISPNPSLFDTLKR